MKKLFLILLCLSLLLIPFQSINSQIKVYDNESVYVLCDLYGKVKKVVLVDWIRVKGEGEYEILDPVKNLTEIKKILGDGVVELKDDKVIIKGYSKDYQDTYYRGNYNGELPFNISIKYYLNGKKLNPKEIIGKSGKVKISIKGESKAKIENETVPLIFVLTSSIDSSKIKEINLSKDTKPQIIGKKYQISLMTILDPEDEIYFEFTSDNIELPEILISIYPGYISFETLDFSFIDNNLSQGVVGLSKLIEYQKVYLEEMKNSLTKFDLSYFNEIEMGISELMLISDGIRLHSNILLQISKSIDTEKLNSIKTIPQILDVMISNLKEINKNLLSIQIVIDGYIEIVNKIKNLNEINKSLANAIKDELKIKLIENLNIESDLINLLLNGGRVSENSFIISLNELKENIKKLYEGYETLLNSLENLKTNFYLVNSLVDLNIKLKDNLDKVVNGGEIEGKPLPGLNNLSIILNSGLEKLKEGIKLSQNKIGETIKEFTYSLNILIKGGKFKDIYFYGIEDTLKGINKIKDGIENANKEIRKQKESLDKKKNLTKKFNYFIGKPESSESSVQFIVKVTP